MATGSIGSTTARPATAGALIPLFIASGAAALVYQVAWQRMLLDAFGADIESATIVVSAFMLGMGCGAIAGGQLADRFPGRAIALFALIELATGAFGAASPALVRATAGLAAQAPDAAVAAAIFGLLLVPTVLMGATLPILVVHVVGQRRSVGFSVGTLYFANTLGAALGAAATGLLAFYYLGLTATVRLAACINLAVAAGAWLWLGRRRG